MKNKIGEDIDAGICKKCGLPKEICVCEDIVRENQNIIIYTEKRKYQKMVTIISGLNMKGANLLDIARLLKKSLASGGTVKNSSIILQGNHLEKAKDLLISNGFKSDRIKIDNNGGN